MTQEAEPQDQQREEKSLVVSSETNLGGLAEDSLLQRLGFSPRLPQLFQGLNEALTKVAPKHLAAEIEMTPGKIPVIETRTEHGANGYKVKIRSLFARNMNSLSIATDDVLPEFKLSLDEIKSFMKEAFPDVEVFLRVQPMRGEEDLEWDKVDQVTEEFLAPYLELPTKWC